jgi:hypothetical protein
MNEKPALKISRVYTKSRHDTGNHSDCALKLTQNGTIVVEGTRVTLDSVVHHFKLGATAEEIAQKFPFLQLADVYAAIT